jgi:hypothetical protein
MILEDTILTYLKNNNTKYNLYCIIIDMNSEQFYNTLVSSVNKLSVNGGKSVLNNVNYPASDVKSNSPNMVYRIIDTSGNVVGTVVNSVFTLGQKTVNTGIELGNGALKVTKKTLNTGLDITREGLLGVTDTAYSGISSLHSLGDTGQNIVYKGVGRLGTGAYNITTDIGKTGFDVMERTVHGVRTISNDGFQNVHNLSTRVTNNVKDIGTTIGDKSIHGIQNLSNNVKILGTSAVDTGSNLVQGVTKMGTHAINTVTDLTRDVISGTLEVGSKVVNTGIDIVNDGIDTGKNLLNNGVNTGVDVVNDVGRTAYTVGKEGLATGANLTHDAIHGINEVANNGINTTKKVLNIGSSRLNNSGNIVSSGIDDIKHDFGVTGNRIKHTILKGGNQNVSGVSVLNLNNDSSRMLIPTNFLTSKHVYFVRYNSEGTNVYNFKLQMRGGKVNFLKQVDVNPVWKTSKFADFAPDGMLIEGKQILNNLISDLKTTQYGGIVEQRVCDKDQVYMSKKLRYLSLIKN